MTKHAQQTESFDRSDLITRDGHALFGSAGRAIAGQVVALVAGLATTILTIRLLNQASYGRFALFFMFLEILSHIIGWPNLGLVRLGRAELGQRGTLAETFWTRLALFGLCALPALALLILSREPLNSYLPLEYPLHIVLMLYLLLSQFVLLARTVFQTVSNFRSYALVTASVKFVNLCLLIVVFVLLARPAGPARILGTHIISLGIVTLLCLAMLPWRSLLPLRVRSSVMRRMAVYSWPLFLAGLTSLVVNWVDLAVIRQFRSDAEVGLYAAAYQLVTVLIALHVALISAVIPLLVSLVIERRREALIGYLDKALPQTAWVLGLGSLLLCAGAEAVPLVFGPRYQLSVEPCQVLIAGTAFFIFAGFQAALAKALDRVPSTLAVGLILATLNVLFDLALVPTFGIRGAAVATAIACVLSGLFYFPILNSERNLRGRRPLRRYCALLGLCAPIFMASASLLFQKPLIRIGAALVILLIWAGLAKALSVFPRTSLANLARVEMPPSVRRLLETFYAVLGRETEGQVS